MTDGAPGAGGRPDSRPGPIARAENALAVAILCGMAILPLLEIVGRKIWRTGIPGSSSLVQHGTLWIGFLGGAIAARDGRLLSFGGVRDRLPESWRVPAALFTAAVAAGVSALLALAGADLVVVEREGGATLLPHVPLWLFETAIPAGFALIAWRLVRRVPGSWGIRSGAAILGAVFAAFVSSSLLSGHAALLAAVAVTTAAVVLGAPVFVALGGLAVLLFRHEGVPLASIPAQIYQLVTSPTLPTIPLFTFAGYIISSGNASGRLVRFFRALVGWMPGAIALVAIFVCVFFTTFTGASGVTILALGGILMPALIAEGYPGRFSLGLLTSAGSIGMLFPPCLTVILYAVVAGIAVDRMFLGGILPGSLLVVLMGAMAVRAGRRTSVRRIPFSAGELGRAAWEAKWDLLLPVIILAGIFGGFATTVETAALAVLYPFAVEFFLHRDVSLRRDFPRVGTESASLIGGVLVILAAAMGMTNYMVDAGVPEAILDWVRSTIHSKVVFLLAVNVLLLLVGCLMDIFSAIIVVVPIIAPMAPLFGVDPVHLGIIFLANMELGYLTPLVGVNIFLSAYRFERSLGEVIRATVPFYLLILLGVLLVTYVPSLTTILLR